MTTKFIPCRECAKKPGPRPGYFYAPLTSTQRAIIECECHRKYRIQVAFETKARTANIWTQAKDYDPQKNYKGTKSLLNVNRLVKYARNFNQYSSILVYMYGPNGTQKTTLAQWAGATLLLNGRSVQYLLMQSLISLLSSGFDSDEEKLAKINKLQQKDLLIVDEAFSKDKVTLFESGYQLPFLDRFLRERLEINKKGMIIVSNKAPEMIEGQKFSKSIQDFIDRNSRQSRLLFEDNYLQEAADFQIGSIFDDN